MNTQSDAIVMVKEGEKEVSKLNILFANNSAEKLLGLEPPKPSPSASDDK